MQILLKKKSLCPIPERYKTKILKIHKRIKGSYTQGLLVQDGKLYESSGDWGKSYLRITDIKNKKILASKKIDSKLFAEGLTLIKGTLILLTWKKKIAFYYDPKTLKLKKEIAYKGQGWGLTDNGKELIMSNGTSILSFRDPRSFKLLRKILVRIKNKKVSKMNELEFINDYIYANVWKKNWLVKINPNTGCVNGLIDSSNLKTHISQEILKDEDSVLNGIAYDKETKKIYMTGKNWPKIFEVKFEI